MVGPAGFCNRGDRGRERTGKTGWPGGAGSRRIAAWERLGKPLEAGGARGRWLVAGLLAAACAAAGAAAWGGRDYLEDSWWIWKLGSADREARVLAGERLAERKCIRAVPGIVDAIGEDPAENITVRSMLFVTDRSDLGAPRDWERIERARASPLVFALWQMGEPAFPSLKRCLDDERLDSRTRSILTRLVYERPTALEREPPQ